MLLGYFKYGGFFSVSEVIMPLGISFFTFTQTAYLVEAYKNETKNNSFISYLLFVTFFPYITSGPIVEHKKIIPQLKDQRTFKINWENIAKGLSIFIIGLFKKVYIADRLAPTANYVFSNSQRLTMTDAWLGALGYTFQLYFDFSGYSDMAIGIALIFNIELPVNFNSPYKSESLIDFWRRWHMTLSQWIKNYIYIPLGGNRNGEIKKMRNVFFAMIFTGLWHGAGLTFILWGALHGIFLMINHQWRRLKIKIPVIFSRIITFILVVISWVFFRAKDFNEASGILCSMFNFNKFVVPERLEQYLKFLNILNIHFGITAIHVRDWVVYSIYIFSLLIIINFAPNSQKMITKFKANYKWLIMILSAGILSLINFSHVSDFLYFQF